MKPSTPIASLTTELPASHAQALQRMVHRWSVLLVSLLLALILLPIGPTAPPGQPVAFLSLIRPALAGPVEWREVPAGPEGRQWWDAGSLRRDRRGRLSVLSRFQPAEEASNGRLYVMELDCDQQLYRDVAVNGLPRWGSEWSPAAGDSLTMETLRAACAAAPQPDA